MTKPARTLLHGAQVLDGAVGRVTRGNRMFGAFAPARPHSGPASTSFVAGAVIVDCDTLQLVDLDKRNTRN